MKKIYDFHTHISKKALTCKCKCNDNEIVSYIDQGIVPIINIQNLEEFKYYKTAECIYDREVLNSNKENFNCNILINRIEDSVEAIEKLAEEHGMSDAYFSVGVHPFHADQVKGSFANLSAFESLVKNADFVGEIGMDNCWSKADILVQKDVFEKCLILADKYNKKVILHTKNMEKEILDVIKKYELTYIVHWYDCEDYIQEYLDLGSYFTIGPAVFTNEKIVKLVEKCPIDKLLIETDGIDAIEWLKNEKIEVTDIRGILESVIEKISQIKKIDKYKVYDQINDNSVKLLKL